jgi:hypothetical protein
VVKWEQGNPIFSNGKQNYLIINSLWHSYHKGIFTRISPTIGVEFLTKKIVLENGTVIKA